MIELGKPRFGWMSLTIGGETFCVSYLCDILEELDYLFELRDCETRLITLDGEDAGYLYLVAYRLDDSLIINWTLNDEATIVFRFDYERFMAQYGEQKDDISKEDYERYFLMEGRHE